MFSYSPSIHGNCNEIIDKIIHTPSWCYNILPTHSSLQQQLRMYWTATSKLFDMKTTMCYEAQVDTDTYSCLSHTLKTPYQSHSSNHTFTHILSIHIQLSIPLFSTGLNHLYSRMNHSCNCNTHTTCGTRAEVSVYALRPIEPMEEVQEPNCLTGTIYCNGSPIHPFTHLLTHSLTHCD